MKLTNALNLPTPFVDAVNQEYQYTPDRYSVTQILQDPTKVVLERRFNDEKTQDVADMVWLIFGSAVHSILENSQAEECEHKEQKLECSMKNGKTLSGIFDLYNEETQTVTDYKTASVWKAIHGDWEDYRKQLLCYCYILRRNGKPATNGRIVALLKDHSKTKAKVDFEYPRHPVVVVDFEFSEQDFKDIEEELETRLAVLNTLEKYETDNLPPCSEEFRWNDGEKFAVMKNNNKRAARVLDNESDAKAYISEHEGDGCKYTIQRREGLDRRCEDYCDVCEFCPYYQSKHGGKF